MEPRETGPAQKADDWFSRLRVIPPSSLLAFEGNVRRTRKTVVLLGSVFQAPSPGEWSSWSFWSFSHKIGGKEWVGGSVFAKTGRGSGWVWRPVGREGPGKSSAPPQWVRERPLPRPRPARRVARAVTSSSQALCPRGNPFVSPLPKSSSPRTGS